MAHKIGDKVVFVGRESELGAYHPDFSQLMYQTGTVVELGHTFLSVIFDGFVDSTGDNIFMCLERELESAP